MTKASQTAMVAARHRCTESALRARIGYGCLLFGAIGMPSCSSRPDAVVEVKETTAGSAPRLRVEKSAKLIARLDLGDTHAVEFVQFRNSHIGLREIGQEKDAGQRVDFRALEGKSISDVYRFLSKDPQKPIPPALAEAATVRPPLPNPTDGPSPQDSFSETKGDGAPVSGVTRAPGNPAFETGTGQRSAGQRPPAEDSWWSDNFCGTSDVDAVWCLPDNAWASTGTRPTMFYEASGYSVGPTSVASYWVDEWRGDWQRVVDEAISPGWWVTWHFDNSSWYRSAISGNDPDWHIHFAERYRNAAPGLTEVGAHPTEGDAHYWTEELQGITHNNSHWFLTNHWNVMRFPLTSDLSAYPDVFVGNPWRHWFGHLGAPTFANDIGRVVVPLEREGVSGRAGLGLLDTSLVDFGYRLLPAPAPGIPDEQADSCPWVAYNAADHYYYSSGFDPHWIYVYYIDFLTNLLFVRAVQILDGNGNPTQLHAIQGGTFSPSGKLYLSSDDTSDTDRGRIYLVDVNNGRVQGTWMTERHTGWSKYEEIEGITFWDSNGTAPGVTGQLHLMLLDQDAGDDDWYLKHFSFSGPP